MYFSHKFVANLSISTRDRGGETSSMSIQYRPAVILTWENYRVQHK